MRRIFSLLLLFTLITSPAYALFGVGESGNVGTDWTNTDKNLNTSGVVEASNLGGYIDCSGADDDGAAQTAIDAAGIGGKVYFKPDDTCVFNNGISLTEAHRGLFIEGNGVTISRDGTAGANPYTFRFLGADNWASSAAEITMQNMILDGGGVALDDAINMHNAMRNIFNNVIVTRYNSATTWAFHLHTDGVWNNYFNQVQITDCENGAYLGTASSTSQWNNLETYEIDQQIIKIEVSNQHKFTNCTLQGGNTDDDGTPIIDISSNEIVFDSCRFDGARSSIWIDGQNDGNTFYDDASDIVFINCHFTHYQGAAAPAYTIMLDHASKVQFIGSFITPTVAGQPLTAFVNTTSSTDNVLFQNIDFNSVTAYDGAGTNVVKIDGAVYNGITDFNTAIGAQFNFTGKRTAAGNSIVFKSTDVAGADSNRLILTGGADIAYLYIKDLGTGVYTILRTEGPFQAYGVTTLGDGDGDLITIGDTWTAAGKTCNDLGTVTASTSIMSTQLTGTNFRISNSITPASGAACTAGTMGWDAGYIYVCTASGAWKRVALTGGY